MSSYLITGTSRGIGLEMVRQLLQAPSSQVSSVIAITRNKNSTQLNEIIQSSQGRGHNVVIEDITDEKTIQAAVPAIEKIIPNGLDILINNAGQSDWAQDGFKSVTAKHITEIFNTNVGSVQAVTATLLPLLQKGKAKKIINISTTLGSISRVDDYLFAPTYGYKTSKAALNMLTVLWARELKDEKFIVTAITPGWLKTDLGSQSADLDVAVGVKSVLEIIENVTPADSGVLKNIHVAGYEDKQPNGYDGKNIPW